MNLVMKLQLKQSELREQINSLLPIEERTKEQETLSLLGS